MNSLMNRKTSRECTESLWYLFFASTGGLLGTPIITAILMVVVGYAVGEPGVDMANMFLDNHLPSFMESAGHFYLVGITGLALLFGFRAENAGLLFTRIDRLWIRPVIDATRRLFTSITQLASMVVAWTYSAQMCHRVPIHRTSRTGLDRASNLAGAVPRLE